MKIHKEQDMKDEYNIPGNLRDLTIPENVPSDVLQSVQGHLNNVSKLIKEQGGIEQHGCFVTALGKFEDKDGIIIALSMIGSTALCKALEELLQKNADMQRLMGGDVGKSLNALIEALRNANKS